MENRAESAESNVCWIGSVKTNIGHLEAAAGIAGLVKTALALHYGQIPPHLHLTGLNPHISLSGTPLAIPTALQPWPGSAAGPRTAGISSFGFGGTNAHVNLQSAPEREDPMPAAGAYALALSAGSTAALKELAARMAEHLRVHPDVALADVAASLQARARFSERLAFTAGSIEEAIRRLESFVAGAEESPGTGPVLSSDSGRRIPLPTYPFQRRYCWIEPVSVLGRKLSQSAIAPDTHIWETTIAVNGASPLAPLAFSTFADMALAAASEVAGGTRHRIVNLDIREPLFVKDAPVTLQIVLARESNARWDFKVYNRRSGGWNLSVSAEVYS
jgi:acyl transferase domain-containing protein